MICGIGVDLVELNQFRAQIRRLPDSVLGRIFTPAERIAAGHRNDPIEYLAGRFASKEAVYKAIRFTIGKPLDLRKIEILARSDGSPCFNPSDTLKAQLDRVGIGAVHISITDEKDYVAAFAVAERAKDPQ